MYNQMYILEIGDDARDFKMMIPKSMPKKTTMANLNTVVACVNHVRKMSLEMIYTVMDVDVGWHKIAS